jgi:hypothetical protein
MHTPIAALLALAAFAALACAKAPREEAAPARTTQDSASAATTADPSAPPSSPVASLPADCGKVLEPPAGADLLCDEHVLGSGAEIHWRSYGVADDRASVNQRFREAVGALASRCSVGLVFKPPLFSIMGGDRRLETFEASDPSYPKCGKAPAPAHRTVIVVSDKMNRGP